MVCCLPEAWKQWGWPILDLNSKTNPFPLEVNYLRHLVIAEEMWLSQTAIFQSYSVGGVACLVWWMGWWLRTSHTFSKVPASVTRNFRLVWNESGIYPARVRKKIHIKGSFLKMNTCRCQTGSCEEGDWSQSAGAKLPGSLTTNRSRKMRLRLTGKITFALFCFSWDQHFQACVQAKNEHGD